MRLGRRGVALLCLAATVLGADLSVVAARAGDHPQPKVVASSTGRPELARRIPRTPPSPPSTTPPAPPTTQPPPTTTTTAPPIPAAASRPARLGAWTLGPYQGLGAWIDVYDWTAQFTNGQPKVQVADVDRMADLGIQTLYVQTAHNRNATADVLEPERLIPLIDRAHARGMDVVAWYLPTFEDTSTDLRRLVAASQLPVDGLGVDIESLAVADPGERTRRLLQLSTALRQAMGTKVIAAITPSAVHLQVVNPSYWPVFPWPEVGTLYDVILPMSYWSGRRPAWHSGELYTGTDIDRIRASTGKPNIPIHVVGGIADGVTLDDLVGMVRAIQSRGILGGSLYDWNTSQPAQWELLKALRIV